MIEYPTDLEEHYENVSDLYRSYNDNFESVKFSTCTVTFGVGKIH